MKEPGCTAELDMLAGSHETVAMVPNETKGSLCLGRGFCDAGETAAGFVAAPAAAATAVVGCRLLPAGCWLRRARVSWSTASIIIAVIICTHRHTCSSASASPSRSSALAGCRFAVCRPLLARRLPVAGPACALADSRIRTKRKRHFRKQPTTVGEPKSEPAVDLFRAKSSRRSLARSDAAYTRASTCVTRRHRCYRRIDRQGLQAGEQ